ncbi:MAG TPA: AAA family ATPase, partial [Acidimicrobiales bacterium]|nr:AAA family ATPase [Acidimicrobiales bacterium]
MVGPVTPQRQPPGPPGNVFVGRSPELAALAANLAWAAAGEPRVVVIEGPAGMGKSALVRAFLAQAGPQVPVLAAGGEEPGPRRRLGVVGQLLSGAGLPAPGIGPECEPLQAGAQLLEVLATVSDGGPMVLAFEDVQWADLASVQALTFALRRLHADRVLAVLTRREGTPPLPGGLQRLVDGRGQRLRLGGLDAIALAEMAVRLGAGRLPVAAAERLRHHCGGSPLHARALLEDLDAGDLRRESGALPAPRSFAAVVAAKVEACPAPARALVQAAAVLGERCSLPTAVRLAGLDAPGEALEAAVATSLLDVEADPTSRSVCFTHRLVRAAVYGDLRPSLRAELHTRAATITAGQVAVDHRVAATSMKDAELSGELRRLAAAEAAGGAPAQAAGHLVAAARLDPDTRRAEQCLLDAAGLHLGDGETSAAAELVAAVSGDLPARRALAGRLALVAGRLDEARLHLEEAWKADAAPALLATQLGQLALQDARAEEAVMWGHRALEATGGGPAERSAARSVVAIGLGLAGRGEEALAFLETGAG